VTDRAGGVELAVPGRVGEQLEDPIGDAATVTVAVRTRLIT
jgi:hypothetical protein